MANENVPIVRTVIEGKFTPAEAANYFGVYRRWVYELLRRHRTQGDQALLVFSRCPASNPHATSEPVRTRVIALHQDLDLNGLNAGVVTITWLLKEEGLPVPAVPTIYRVLRAHGLVVLSHTNGHDLLRNGMRQPNLMKLGSPTLLIGP